ncbi:unnamed protein product [Effrenium voratum]|uniref:WW domain-containing protein n=1 Tax=Effrenium voratum TaxID=2562239 RepID=A0AA36IBK2_9DINO|nr:unnamed protein product [Effrenium voratum]
MEHLVQGFQAFSTSTVVPSQEEQLQSLGGPSHELGGCQDSKVEELRIQAAKATPSFQMPDKPAFKFTPSVGSWLQSKPPQAEDAKEAPTYWTLWRTEEGKFYFHNEDTDKTAWDLPPGGVVYLDEDALSMFLEQDLRPGTEEILAWRRGWGQWCSPPPSAVIRDSRTERSFSYETSLEADSEVEEWLFGDAGGHLAGDLDTNSLPDQNDLKSEAEASSTSTVVQLESPGGPSHELGGCQDSKVEELRIQMPEKPAFKFTPSVGSWLQRKPPQVVPMQAEDVKVTDTRHKEFKEFLCDVPEEGVSWWDWLCVLAA